MLQFLVIFFILPSAKKSDVPSLETYQPTMSYFRPIMPNLPTYLKSDVINGRSPMKIYSVGKTVAAQYFGFSTNVHLTTEFSVSFYNSICRKFG